MVGSGTSQYPDSGSWCGAFAAVRTRRPSTRGSTWRRSACACFICRDRENAVSAEAKVPPDSVALDRDHAADPDRHALGQLPER